MFELTAKYLNKDITAEVIARLNPNGRKFLETMEQSLTQVAMEAPETNWDSDPRDLLRIAAKKVGVVIPKRVFLNLHPEDNFEIWSFDLKLWAAGSHTLRRISYPLEELWERDWRELLERDPVAEKLIEEAMIKLQSGVEILFDVAPHHLVRERGAQQTSVMVAVKTVAVARDEQTNLPCAFVVVTNIKDAATA